MDNYSPQSHTSSIGCCSRTENDNSSPNIESRELAHLLHNPQGPSRWKPLIECPDLNIPPEPAIFVPDPSPGKAIHDSDGDTPKSETSGGSLSRRRRHGEYHHRPPVWTIRPLDEDVSAFSSVEIEVDSDTFHSLAGLNTDNSSPRSFSSPTARPRNLISQSNVFHNSINSAYPHSSLPENTPVEAHLDALASTWAREPFIVAMAVMDEKSNGSDGGQGSTGTGSINPEPREPSPTYRYRPSPRGRVTSWSANSSTRSIESDKSQYTDASASQEPESGVVYTNDSAGPSRTSGDVYDPLQDVDERDGLEEHGHFQLVKVPSLSPVIEQPQDEHSPPRELEGGQSSEREELCSASTTEVEQRQGSSLRPCRQYGEHGDSEHISFASTFPGVQLNDEESQQFCQSDEEHISSGNNESSTPVRMQQPQGANLPTATPVTEVTGMDQLLPPYQQQRIDSLYIESYRDIRFLPPKRAIGFPLPPKRMFGWAIESGSRVICVCDTVTGWTYKDVFPMRLGDAYIVLKMYGDFWASCLKLTLDNQTWSAYPIYETHRDRAKATFICPDDNVKFLPLCALTLDANFGDYLARHPKNGGSCYSPATGQLVVPPARSYSSPIGLKGSSVVVPKKILRQAKYPNMPRNMSVIAAHDFQALDIGHVCGSKPSELINVDPDFTHFRPTDNIWRFKARLGRKLSRQSLRDASEKIQESSGAFAKFIGGQLRRKFHSDPGDSRGGQRFFARQRAPSTGTSTRPSENDLYQSTVDDVDTPDRTQAATGDSQNTTEDIADSSRGARASEGYNCGGGSPQRNTTNAQQGSQVKTTVNELKR
ncbi:hypothetical protein AJ78_00135 [Emergomyces pasteurianus Ep9510]|uniref:Uncharacterized protein n=1 Tax=Emergomyces pasteurianus Ep9510 TaxID=1447872 RepID=A0A1J9QX93_9EURO|nr:hypothetical protein AJ78_00135 [Emergomyces pasteurianus Ep9510]